MKILALILKCPLLHEKIFVIFYINMVEKMVFFDLLQQSINKELDII